jgi:quinol monooxygenase YgiN
MMKTKVFPLVFTLLFMIAACSKKQTTDLQPAETATVSDSLTQKMITAKIFLKPDKVTDFIEAAKAMIDSSRSEAGCISYSLYQDPYDQTNFIFVENWKNQAAIDIHFAKSYFTAFGPKTSDWMAKPSELKIIDVVATK